MNPIQLAGQMFQQLKQNVGNAFNQAGSAIQHIAQPIEQGVGQVAQGIEGDISRLPQQLPQALPNITSDFFNNPANIAMANQVPSLAQQAVKQVAPMVTDMISDFGEPKQHTKDNGAISTNPLVQNVINSQFPAIKTIQQGGFPALGQEIASNVMSGKTQVMPDFLAEGVTAKIQLPYGENVKPNSNGLLPFGDTQGILPEASKTVEKMIPQIQQNRTNYDNPNYMAQNLLKDKDWNTFLDKHPEINNHGDTVSDIGKGPEPLRNMNGYIGYISTDKGTIPLDPKQEAAVIDNRVVTQWTANNGDQELAIVRRNPAMPTAYDIIDRHHGIPAARALGVDKVPTIILHKNAPALSDVYDALKSGKVAPVDIKGGFDLESQAQEQQGLKEAIGGEAALTPAKIQELAPELTTDAGKAKVQGILDKAKTAQPELDESFKAIAKDAGLDPEKDFESRVKNPDTFVQKVAQHRLEGTEEYSAKGVNDPYGGRFIANTPAQKGQIISAINDMDRNGELKILKQQQVTKDTYSAYHVDFVKNGVRGELQVHDPNSFLESVVNHEIRAQAGEKPPPVLNAEKQANAQAAAQMPPELAQPLAKATEQAHVNDTLMPWEEDLTPSTGKLEDKYTRIISDRELEEYNKSGILSPGDNGNSRLLNPGQLTKTQGIGASKKHLVILNDNIKNLITDSTDRQSQFKGGIDKGYVNKVIPNFYDQSQEVYSSINKDLGVKAEDTKQQGNTPGYVPPSGETKNQVTLKISGANDAEKIQSAIVNSERIKNEISIRGKDAYVAGTKLSPEDLKLAEQYQEGVPIETLAQQAQNPKAFTNFMQKIIDYYDFRLAADHAVGGETPMRENYLRQRWDLSDPQKMADFNELATQKGAKPWNGYSNQPRIFNTYAKGEAAGFTRLNPDILGDLQDDYNGASFAISRQALKQGLAQAVPDKVASNGVGYTQGGKPFVNSNITGLEGMAFHPDVMRKLQGYQPLTTGLLWKNITDATKESGDWMQGLKQGLARTGTLDTLASLYDGASAPMKRFLLSMSGFHSINISGNYVGSQIFNPLRATTGLLQSVPAYFSEGVTQHIIDGFKGKMIPGKDYSVFDAGLRAGIKMDRELPNQGLSKLNPFSEMQKAMFDRELYTMKLNLIDQVFGSGKVDPESPQGARVGQEIEKVMGEMNTRTMNLNPNTMKLASRVFLAPQFTLSKASTLVDAFTKGGPQGNMARTSVLGKTILFGTLATLGTKLMTGNYPALQQILTNYTINPTIQTNLTNPKGRKQDIALPQTFISEFSKPLMGLVQGDTTNLQHYGQARLNPLLSGGQSALTNKDYYGNPIVNPQSKTPAVLQMAQNIGTSKLPIGVQNVVNMSQGKITSQQAAIQIAGLRTTTNKNDPTMQYFSALKSAHDSLTNPNDQAVFDSIHPQTKDNFGNPLIDKTIRMTPEKYDVLLHNPKVLAAEAAFEKAQPNHDPLWDLTPQQRNLYMASQVKLPGQKTTYSKLLQTQSWYQPFLQARDQWYQSLPQNTSTSSQNAQGGTIPYPTASSYVQQQMNAKNWNDPQVQSYFKALDAYNNSQLQAMGLPPTAGTQGAQGGKTGKGGFTSSQRRGSSARLPIKGGTGKLAAVAKSSGGKMLAGGTLGKGMLATQAAHQATMQAHAQVKAKAPKVSFGGGTKGAIRGITGKVAIAKIKQPTLQTLKQLPIQKVNLKKMGGGQHSRTYGKYQYM